MVKTVIEHVSDCVGCPPETGCMGQACPYHPHDEEREVLVCDACGEEVDDLCRAPYQAEESWVCEECLKEMLVWKRGESLT